MNMKQLEYFIKIAECGSISRGRAGALRQPAEPDEGHRRSGGGVPCAASAAQARGVELTIEGKSFLHYARSIVTAANALESNFSGQGGAGQLAPVRRLAAARLCPSAHPEDLSAKSGPQPAL